MTSRSSHAHPDFHLASRPLKSDGQRARPPLSLRSTQGGCPRATSLPAARIAWEAPQKFWGRSTEDFAQILSSNVPLLAAATRFGEPHVYSVFWHAQALCRQWRPARGHHRMQKAGAVAANPTSPAYFTGCLIVLMPGVAGSPTYLWRLTVQTASSRTASPHAAWIAHKAPGKIARDLCQIVHRSFFQISCRPSAPVAAGDPMFPSHLAEIRRLPADCSPVRGLHCTKGAGQFRAKHTNRIFPAFSGIPTSRCGLVPRRTPCSYARLPRGRDPPQAAMPPGPWIARH